MTQAYDILTDKDKRAQYDRGEIDEEGNPKMPFGFGGGGAQPGGGRGGFRGPNGEPFEFGGDAEGISDLFEGLFGGAGRRGRGGGGGGPFSGFGRRPQRRKRAPTSPTGSKCRSRTRPGSPASA